VWAIPASEILERFKNRMTNFENLSGTISWTTQLGITYIGNFKYINPGKLYIKITSPQSSLLVANRKKLWLYDPSHKICSLQNLDNKLSGGIVNLIKEYQPILSEKTADGYIIQLVNSSKPYPTIIISMDETFFLKKTVLIDKANKETNLTIISPSTTENIMKKFFKFEVPANTQVIKNPLDIK